MSIKYSSNICGKVKDANPINITLFTLSFNEKLFCKKNKTTKYNIAVIDVSGIAFLTKIIKPLLNFLLNSKISFVECLNECRKQKYRVNARKGSRKTFKTIIEKKSENKINLLLKLSFLHKNKLDKKDKNKINSKNSCFKKNVFVK